MEREVGKWATSIVRKHAYWWYKRKLNPISLACFIWSCPCADNNVNWSQKGKSNEAMKKWIKSNWKHEYKNVKSMTTRRLNKTFSHLLTIAFRHVNQKLINITWMQAHTFWTPCQIREINNYTSNQNLIESIASSCPSCKKKNWACTAKCQDKFCCSDDLVMFTPSPKMAGFDLAEEPVGVEWLVVAVPEAMNSTALVLGSTLVAVRQTPPQLEAATEL